VGKQLPEAVQLLSSHNLNTRLMAEKEDLDLPDYTIISQTPREHTRIKAHQSVFLVLTRQPQKPLAPHLIGESQEAICQKLVPAHIRYKCYGISSNLPTGSCIAQFPRPGEQLDTNFLICYISKGNQKPVLFPDLRSKTIQEVSAFLSTHDLTADIIGNTKNTDSALIYEQRPLPGSIITLNTGNQPNIQLHVK